MIDAILGFAALALLVQAGLVGVRSIGEVRVGERRPLVLAAIRRALGPGA